MNGNRYLVADRSILLKAKLDKLTVDLQNSLSNGNLITQEQYILEVSRILGDLQTILTEPFIDTSLIEPETYPDPAIYDELWQYILDMLTAVFQEFENIEALTISNFNFTMMDVNRLIGKMKHTASLLGDYILYAVDSSKDNIYFSDSFVGISKLEPTSSLLRAVPCEVNQGEGIVTLPTINESEALIPITLTPVVNTASNGVRGNNEEVGAQSHANLTDVLDGNPDTWFEYERVIRLGESLSAPLVLDLTLTLDEAQIVNHIYINPNNFGAKTSIKIEAIDTSVNGSDFVSIKDEMPIIGFTIADDENSFSLAPSSSKFAGEGFFTFPPRLVKFVHIVLSQSVPYIITTSSGDKSRYAIGIRDIQVKAIKFQPVGELVSQPFYTSDEIRKVILRTKQMPVIQSGLGDIDYSLSPDNGTTWHSITSDTFNNLGYLADKTSVPEITDAIFADETLDFNGSESDSIKTQTPVQSLRLKIHMERHDDVFSQQSTNKKNVINTSEPLSLKVPLSNQNLITLENKPVDGRVKVVEVGFGSCGKIELPYTLGFQAFTQGQQSYYLPITAQNIPRKKGVIIIDLLYPVFDTRSLAASNAPFGVDMDNWVFLFVNGERWLHSTVPLSEASENDKVYIFDPSRSALYFGDGTNGKAIPDGAKVDIYFSEDELFVDSNGKADLSFVTTNNKDLCQLVSYAQEQTGISTIPASAKTIKLNHQNIVDTAHVAQTLTNHGFSEKDFVNGSLELAGGAYWSMDKEHGVLYLSQHVSYTQEIAFSYMYQPTTVMPNSSWEWQDSDAIHTGILINPNKIELLQRQERLLFVNQAKVVELRDKSIFPQSVRFIVPSTVASAQNPFLQELAYVDGVQEFSRNIVLKTQVVPALSIGLNTFQLADTIYTDTDYPVFFTQPSIFGTDVGIGTPNMAGEYTLDRTTGVVSVFTSVAWPLGTAGKISYPVQNVDASSGGRYSIDYKHGIVFTDRPLQSSWGVIEVRYNYTDLRFSYPIVRPLPEQAYTYKVKDNGIAFNDTEAFYGISNILKRPDGLARQYLALYKYYGSGDQVLSTLKDFFTPILNEYTLKVLTKGKLF